MTVRATWPFLNPTDGGSDYRWIDDAVDASNEFGLLINLETLNDICPPWVVEKAPSGQTYLRGSAHQGQQLTVKPWSTVGQQEFARYLNNLADHMVPAPGGSGMVRFADHPHLYQLGVTIPGLGDFRDRPDLNTMVALDLPDYTRAKLLEAAVTHMQIAVDAFPGKFIWNGRWSVANDKEGSNPTLDTAIDQAFAEAFDWDTGRPKVGWFMENLACETPTVSYAEALHRNQNRTFLAFQMLQSWDPPFRNPAKTDPCLTANGGPDVGLDYMYDNFKAGFADTYTSDLDKSRFDAALLAWHRKVAALNLDAGWNTSAPAPPAPVTPQPTPPRAQPSPNPTVAGTLSPTPKPTFPRLRPTPNPTVVGTLSPTPKPTYARLAPTPVPTALRRNQPSDQVDGEATSADDAPAVSPGVIAASIVAVAVLVGVICIASYMQRRRRRSAAVAMSRRAAKSQRSHRMSSTVNRRSTQYY